MGDTLQDPGISIRYSVYPEVPYRPMLSCILHPSEFYYDVAPTIAGTLSRRAGTTQRKQSRQIEWLNWSRLWAPVVSKFLTMLHRSLPVSCPGIQVLYLYGRYVLRNLYRVLCTYLCTLDPFAF
jgi:hypothetical protein